MKARIGFVSNSSSCSFIIKNTTNKTLTLEDFVKENPELVVAFNHCYNGYNFNQEQMLANAKTRNQKFKPGKNIVSYGDEDGDTLGHVFDYILRNGGSSESFSWRFYESLR